VHSARRAGVRGRPRRRSQRCAATGPNRVQLPTSAGTGGVPAPPSSHDVRRSPAFLLHHLHTLLCSVICPSAAASSPLRSSAHTSSSRCCTRARASSSAGAGLLLAAARLRGALRACMHLSCNRNLLSALGPSQRATAAVPSLLASRDMTSFLSLPVELQVEILLDWCGDGHQLRVLRVSLSAQQSRIAC